MRAMLFLLPLLVAACVRQDAVRVRNSPANSAEVLPSISSPAANAAKIPPAIDESEQTYVSNAAVVRLLQDWAKANGSEQPLQRVEVEEIAAMPGRYVAICDSQYEWWGFACCLKIEQGKIAKLWVLEEQSEQSMGSITSKFLDGPKGPIPVIVAFGQTHMGHGSLYVYEFKDVGPRLLLDTPAVDHHFDTDLYRGGKLQALFEDLNGDNCFDVTLLGIRDTYTDGSDGSPPNSSEIVQRIFLFDKAKGQLVEDKTQRIGHRHLEE